MSDCNQNEDNELSQIQLDLENLAIPASQHLDGLIDLFSNQGLLSKKLDQYTPRLTQMRMAAAIQSLVELNILLDNKKNNIRYSVSDPNAKVNDITSSHSSHSNQNTADGNAQTNLKQNNEIVDTLIVEAGTGTGKTFAYLVPALRSGGKVIISTGSKHLQDQLYLHDIPVIRSALSLTIKIAILKGRSNYLCLHYLEQTTAGNRLNHVPSKKELHQLSEIKKFSKRTAIGDKSELATVPEEAPIWQAVTSTRENCLGQECEFYKECFVMKARREAQQADMVVVNHHLFFADILLKDTGFADLLPNANTIIFDEAHLLPDIASLFFGETVGTGQLVELARDTLAAGLKHARDAGCWADFNEKILNACQRLRAIFQANNMRISSLELLNNIAFNTALEQITDILISLNDVLSIHRSRDEALANCFERCERLLTRFAQWQAIIQQSTSQNNESVSNKNENENLGKNDYANNSTCTSTHLNQFNLNEFNKNNLNTANLNTEPTQTEYIAWLEIFSQSIQFHLTPLTVGKLFNKYREGRPRAWIFTSATLSVKNSFKHFAALLNLNADRAISLPSPFNYEKQALLYVPQDLPIPAASNYLDMLIDSVLPIIVATRGRAFFLCTTLRAVDYISNQLQQLFEKNNVDLPILTQGQASRSILLNKFKQTGNAVLIGSQSFWEGVDVVGETLSLVIIDKLPFASPDDPVMAARLDALKKNGLHPFTFYQIPQAVINLKQGVGRLIRSENDCGILIIGDSRIIDKPYGKQFWQSLPPFNRTRSHTDVINFIRNNL